MDFFLADAAAEAGRSVEGRGGGTDPQRGEAAIRAATREAEDTVNKQKSVMRFTVNDRAEAAFPPAVLRTANGRLTAAEALGHREFVLTRLYESA